MKRHSKVMGMVAALSLTVMAIWHSPVEAATAPVIVPIGTISGLNTPTRIDVDKDGVIYLCDDRANAVLRYDKYSKALPALKGNYKISGTGVAVTPDAVRVYASVTFPDKKVSNAVAILDGKTGEFKGYLNDNAMEFQDALEIDLDADGLIYVADRVAREIKVFSPDTGKFLYKFGGPGTGQSQFYKIANLSVDPYNREVFVTDPSTNSGTVRVQVFDLNGSFKRLIPQASFGNTVTHPTIFDPTGLAFDNLGRGYMLDALREDLRIFASGPTFAFFGAYGTPGVDPGQFSVPYDVIYDPETKRLFVINDSGRVEIYGVDGGTNPVKLNVAPGMAQPLSPVEESEVAVARPRLQWNNSVDADGNVLTYNVAISRDGQSPLNINAIPSGVDTTTYTLASDLAENSKYSWSVQAFDGEAASSYSASQSFWVNAVQEAPAAPVLSSPTVGESLDGAASFSWQAVTDMDPFDTVTYRLEIATDSTFVAPLISLELSGTQSPALGQLTSYSKLQNGNGYFWRVVAVDNHGLASLVNESRGFVYETNVLTIDATFPGAKVYLGGSHAYSGQFVGEAPVELRDLTPGTLRVVVELAGFEPWVGQVALGEKANAKVRAVLAPAIIPAGLKAQQVTIKNRPGTVSIGKIEGGTDLVPFAIDYNQDGRIDLLTADASGKLTLYTGIADDRAVFAAGVKLDLLLPAGAAPVLADWDNSGSQDLIVGTASGSVMLYRNGAGVAEPLLLSDGTPIAVGSGAVPAIFDFDTDGNKDLLVGSDSGTVFFYRNTGSDAEPVLADAPALIPAISTNAAPFVTDWNADGSKDLLVATSQHIFIYLRQPDGSFAARSVLSVNDDLLGTKGKAESGSGYLGERLRLFVYDVDGEKGKDLIVGNASGQIRLVSSFGKVLVSSFETALAAKFEQIREMVLIETPTMISGIDKLGNLIQSKSYVKAREQALRLQGMASGTATKVALGDLAGVLK